MDYVLLTYKADFYRVTRYGIIILKKDAYDKFKKYWEQFSYPIHLWDGDIEIEFVKSFTELIEHLKPVEMTDIPKELDTILDNTIVDIDKNIIGWFFGYMPWFLDEYGLLENIRIPYE